jgi:hypothetical protein
MQASPANDSNGSFSGHHCTQKHTDQSMPLEDIGCTPLAEPEVNLEAEASTLSKTTLEDDEFSWFEWVESAASMSLIFALAFATFWSDQQHKETQTVAQTALIQGAAQHARFNPVDFTLSCQNHRIKINTKGTAVLSPAQSVLKDACKAEDNYTIAEVDYINNIPQVAIEQGHDKEAALLLQNPHTLSVVQKLAQEQLTR